VQSSINLDIANAKDPIFRFEQFLRVLGKSEDTIARYLTVVRDFVALKGSRLEYGKQDVMDYLQHVMGRAAQRRTRVPGQASGTYLRFCFYSLKSFYRCLGIKWGFQKEDVPKLSEPYRPYYEYPEMEKIMRAAKEHGFERDYVLFRLIPLTFARRKGFQKLKRWDYDQAKGTITMPSIKKGRRVVLELDRETKEVMDHYLLARTDQYPALFPSFRPWKDSGELSVAYINKLLRFFAAKAKVPNKGLHAFRRGMVTYLYEHGLREREIFEMGDWTRPDMVFQYVQLSPSFANDIRREVHPFYQEDTKPAKQELREGPKVRVARKGPPKKPGVLRRTSG
jgi:integrase